MKEEMKFSLFPQEKDSEAILLMRNRRDGSSGKPDGYNSQTKLNAHIQSTAKLADSRMNQHDRRRKRCVNLNAMKMK